MDGVFCEISDYRDNSRWRGVPHANMNGNPRTQMPLSLTSPCVDKHGVGLLDKYGTHGVKPI